MSKALVIKGASFAQNAIEQISISDPIPCTGITLSQDSLTFTQVGVTATLTATLTPADTTEAVTWASSDENVVTVNNGVVTCVGLGNATITAYCGEHSASCAVTASITVNADTEYSFVNGYQPDGTELPTKDYIGASSNERGRIYFSGTNLTGGKKAYKTGYPNAYPIPLPKGTSHISIPKVTGVGYIRICAMNSQRNQTYDQSYVSARVVAHIYALLSAASAELDIPSDVGADSFVFGFYTSSGKVATDVTAPLMVTFS